MRDIKLNRCVMLLAIFAIAFNLFTSALFGSEFKYSSIQSQTVLQDIKNFQILDQSVMEDLDVSEVEEDIEESKHFDGDESDVFMNFFSYNAKFQSYLYASLAPYLKPLRSQELPLFLLFESIRL